MRTLSFVLLTLIAAPAAHAQADPVGDWRGALDLGPQQLEIVLHVAAADSGLTATMDVPAQGGFGLPATSATLRNDSLFVVLDAFGIRMRLAVAPDSLRGEFAQGPNTLPLAMGPTAPLARPQTPAGPFPYTEEAVTVESAPGVTLAGTFVRPPGAGPFPGVVFLTGSGPQDRDEEIFEHRPFAVLADALARAGIASLRVDDRGTGASTGRYETATMDSLLVDARAAAGALAARPEIRAVGAIGHSEGGLTAFRLAPDLDFVVALAGPAVRGAELYALQSARAARLAGVDSLDALVFGRAISATLAPMLAEPAAPDSVLAPRMTVSLNEALAPMSTASRMALGFGGPTYVRARDAFLGFVLSPWFRSFALYDPAADLTDSTTPTLSLYGALDFQVPADQSAPVTRTLLADVPGSETVVVENANHLFQTATTGALAEYGQIEETMDPQTISRIVGWITDMTRLND